MDFKAASSPRWWVFRLFFAKSSEQPKPAAELIEQLRACRPPFEIVESELEGAPERALAAEFVRRALPTLEPSITVEFDGAIGERVTQSLSVENPSKAEVTFDLSLEGSRCFTISGLELVVPARSSADVQIAFMTKTPGGSEAVFRAVPRSPGGMTVAKLLGRAILDKIPVFTAAAVLYESSTTTVAVPNVLSEAGPFHAHAEEFVFSGDKDRLARVTKLYQGGVLPSDDISFESADAVIAAHTCVVVKGVDEAGDSLQVTLDLFPLRVGETRALIMFQNDTLAFVAEVKVDVTLPVKQSKVEVRPGKVEIQLDRVNGSLCHALAASMTSRAGLGGDRSDALLASNLRRVHTIFDREVGRKPSWTTESSSAYLKLPGEVSEYRVLGSFAPDGPGEFPFRIVLKGAVDTRVIRGVGISRAATQTLTLSLQAITAQRIRQEVCVPNTGKDAWSFRADLKGSDKFSFPKGFSIAAGTNGAPVLEFCSRHVGEFAATLTVTNLTKDAKVVYELSARVSEPVAQGEVAFEALARQHFSREIGVAGVLMDGNAKVESDLGFLDLPKSITFAAGHAKLKVSGVIRASGQAEGMIRVCDPNSDHFAWFVFRAAISLPEPEETIAVEARVREAATIELPVRNPSSESRRFEVALNDPDLFGPAVFEAAPGESRYSVVFSPAKPRASTVFVTMTNEIEGEFLWRLDLSASPAATRIIQHSAPIGGAAIFEVPVTNPVRGAATVLASLTGASSGFVLAQPQARVKAGGFHVVTVRWTPSRIGEPEMALLDLRSRELGDSSYQLVGVGTPPPLGPSIIFESSGRSVARSIPFRNPFQTRTRFEAAAGGRFEVIGKSIWQLGPNESFELALAWAPTEAGEEDALAISGAGCRWVFPLVGVWRPGQGQVFEVRGVANEPRRGVLALPFADVAQSCTLALEPADGWLSSHVIFTPAGPSELAFELRAQRPVEARAVIGVVSVNGQRWDFDVAIRVDASTKSERVEVAASLRARGSQRLSVDAKFPSDTVFRAYFAPGSSSELSVEPSQGLVLASPAARRELPLEVRFAPKAYGRVTKGTLIVDTRERQFIFEVIGVIPTGTSRRE